MTTSLATLHEIFLFFLLMLHWLCTRQRKPDRVHGDTKAGHFIWTAV